MRKEIEELNNSWDDFISKCDFNTNLTEEDLKAYSSLWVDTFKVLREEWDEEKVNKDLMLLFATIGSFVPKTIEAGEVLGNEIYERVTKFNEIMIVNLFRLEDLQEGFSYDEQGKLILETYDDAVFSVDPERFEIPSLKVLYEGGTDEVEEESTESVPLNQVSESPAAKETNDKNSRKGIFGLFKKKG